MSQQGILSENTSAAKDVEYLQADLGGKVGPDASFSINVFGDQDLGILTEGDPITNTITITHANQLIDQTQTIGAVSADVLTFNLGFSPACLAFRCVVSAFERSSGEGQVFFVNGAATTTGIAGTELSTDSFRQWGSTTLENAQVDLLISGNNAIIRVTGVAGKTIQWKAFISRDALAS